VDAGGAVRDEVFGALVNLPADNPQYREDFFEALLERGVSPQHLAGALVADGDLSEAEIEVLAVASLETPAMAPLLATVGEVVLMDPARGHTPAEVVRWLEADPRSLTPSERAVVALLEVRGLATESGVTLFVEARGADGALDLSSPVVEDLVLDPLRHQLSLEVPDADTVVAVLFDVATSGDARSVEAVLGQLFAEGATTYSELRALPPAAREQLAALVRGTSYEGWLFVGGSSDSYEESPPPS
jgi:hypothetical protein